MFEHTLHDIFLNLTVDELQSYLKIVAPSSTQKIKSGIIGELEGHYKHPVKWLHLLSETEKNALAELRLFTTGRASTNTHLLLLNIAKQ